MSEYNENSGPLEVDGRRVGDGMAPMRATIDAEESVGHDLRGGSAFFVDTMGLHPLEDGEFGITQNGHRVEHLEDNSRRSD